MRGGRSQPDRSKALQGRGRHNVGWGVLKWQDLAGAEETRFGKSRVLAYLLKKIANFLHEFRAADFPSLILPILRSDSSRLNVHAMLSLLFIAGLLLRL